MLTPRHISAVGVLGVSSAALTLVLLPAGCDQGRAVLLYFTSLMLFISCARVRSGDLAILLLLLATTDACAQALITGRVPAWQLFLELAGIGAAILPVKIARRRSLHGSNPYRSFRDRRDHERRRRSRASQPTQVEAEPVTIATAPVRMLRSSSASDLDFDL